MIKISSVCILLQIHFTNAYAESSEDLYKKVFGKSQETNKVVIDATLGDFFLGGVEAVLSGQRVLSLSGSDLEKILLQKIRENKRFRYRFGAPQIEVSKLPFKVTYLASELRVKLEIPAEDLEAFTVNIFDDLVPYYAKSAKGPATFSFGTNYKLENIHISKLDQQNSFSAQTDSFMSFKKVTLENQMNYLSTRSVPWSRQNSRLVYDLAGKMQRIEMGDVSYPILGYQQSRQLGGFSYYKDFSLNPYRLSTPTSSFEYEIESRSLVRTSINGAVIKTEYMNAGRYSIKDIPLNNGLNKIIIEITDEFGKKKILMFNESSASDSLAPGVSRFAFSSGFPAIEYDAEKKYDQSSGAFSTAFYQYGINKTWSSGAYWQGNKDYHLVGINNIFSTAAGNFTLDGVESKNRYHQGGAILGSYQLSLFGSTWYESHSLNTRLEYRSPWFNEGGSNTRNRYDYTFNTSYSVPLYEIFSASVGGSYQHPRFEDPAKYSVNTSLTSKISNTGSVTFFYSRARDDYRVWSTQLYCFLNFSFGESSTYASAFYEKNSDTKRLTVIDDDGKKINSLKVSASADDNVSSKNGSLDLQYNTMLADFGARQDFIKSKGRDVGSRTSVRFLSSFNFVHEGDESAFSIARPISNSFVIFKPNSEWKGQRFGVQSANNQNDSETGLFGEALVSGLTPYQYRRLQLDTSYLKPGYSLGQESFVVYPHYRSGHLFSVGKAGLLVLKGILLDKEKHPLVLKVGYWVPPKGAPVPFFTGRNGEFFIEGVEPVLGKIQIDDDQYMIKELNLSKKKSGIVDLGNVEISNREGR